MNQRRPLQCVEGGLLFFVLGFVSLASQTVLIREALFAFHGGEIGLGLFFALWLAAIAAGARIGSGAVDRQAGNGARAEGVMALGLALLPWAALLGIALFRYHRLVIPVAAGGYLPALPYLLLLLLGVAPVSYLTGFLFPLGLRARRISAGSAYAVESFGSMFGGAFASLYALSRLSAVTLIASTGPLILATLLLVRALGALGQRTESARPMRDVRFPLLLTALLTICLLGGAARITNSRWLEIRWRGLATGTEPVLLFDTPYHQVTLAELAGEISLYIDGLYQGALADPYVDSLTAAVVATQHPRPRKMLLLAPGAYGAVSILGAARDAEVTLVRGDADLDRAIAAVGGSPEGMPAASPLRRLTDDPRTAVRTARERYDLVAILHGGPSSGAANRLYTREFFADCALRLQPGGVLVLDVPGTANVASPEAELLRGSIVAALRTAFADVRIAPGTTHYLFAALPRAAAGSDAESRSGMAQETEATGPLSWDPDTLAARRARLWPGGAPWPAGVFATRFPSDRVTALQEVVQRAAADKIPANSDRHPRVYYEQLRRWDRLSGSGLGSMLQGWHDRPLLGSLLFLLLAALAALLLRRRAGQPVVSLASTGMAGMGADLLLLLLYQTYCGTLYLRVGLVVALFMTGLALGALIGRGLWRAAPPRRAVALADLGWVLLLLAGIPLMGWLPELSTAAAEAVLLAAAGLAGVLTALPFPWVAELLRRGTADDPSRARAGGIADAADHGGAVFGALVTGTFLVPLIGFGGTLLVLAGVKLLVASGWLWGEAGAKRPRRV